MLSPRERPDERDGGLPAERGSEPVVGCVGAERREAVDGDPAAHRIEVRGRKEQRSGAVCDMALQVRVRSGRLEEARELDLGVRRVGVG